MRRCSCCQNPLPGNEDSCPQAVLICSTCRENPKALALVRQLLELHLEEHRERGDFREIFSTRWKDPGRRAA